MSLVTDAQKWIGQGKGDDFTKAVGRRTWALLHGLADNYPCEPCREPFKTLVSGIHDTVNVSLGKPIHDAERWKEFLSLVDKARSHNPRPKQYRHQRISDLSKFDPDSSRTVVQGTHRIVVGCPIGHYTGTRCDVGTQPQAILHPLRERSHA